MEVLSQDYEAGESASASGPTADNQEGDQTGTNQPTAEEVETAIQYMKRRYSMAGKWLSCSLRESRVFRQKDLVYRKNWNTLVMARHGTKPDETGEENEPAAVGKRISSAVNCSLSYQGPGRKPVKV